VVNVQGQPIKISSTHMGAKVLGWTQSTLVRARSKGTRINAEPGDCEREHTQNSCHSLRPAFGDEHGVVHQAPPPQLRPSGCVLWNNAIAVGQLSAITAADTETQCIRGYLISQADKLIHLPAGMRYSRRLYDHGRAKRVDTWIMSNSRRWAAARLGRS